jgi:hypothetical protein
MSSLPSQLRCLHGGGPEDAALGRAGFYFADKVSLISSVYTHRYDGVDHHCLGAMPLLVLSIENAWINGPPARARFNRSYSKVWTALQQGLAHLEPGDREGASA